MIDHFPVLNMLKTVVLSLELLILKVRSFEIEVSDGKGQGLFIRNFPRQQHAKIELDSAPRQLFWFKISFEAFHHLMPQGNCKKCRWFFPKRTI